MSNPKIQTGAPSMLSLIELLGDLTLRANASCIGESPLHLRTLRDLASRGAVRGGQVHDARIAAICLDHSVQELWTADRDFSRFPRLKTRNPLVS